jgi:hypothetical protein
MKKIDTSLKQRAKDRRIVLNNLKPCTGKESYRQRREKKAGPCKACNKNVYRQGNNTSIEGALGRRSTEENRESIDAEVIVGVSSHRISGQDQKLRGKRRNYFLLLITLVIACRMIVPAFSISFLVRPVVTHTFRAAGTTCLGSKLSSRVFSRVIRTPLARDCEKIRDGLKEGYNGRQCIVSTSSTASCSKNCWSSGVSRLAATTSGLMTRIRIGFSGALVQ